jgi:hypothetical protein
MSKANVIPLSHWRRPIFWLSFILLLVPAAFVFAMPAVLFIHPDTGVLVGCMIFTCQGILTIGLPYVVARKIALNVKVR